MKKILLGMFLLGQLAMAYAKLDGITNKEFKYCKGETVYIGRFIQFGNARFQTKIFVERNGKMKELRLEDLEMLIKTSDKMINKGDKVFVKLGRNIKVSMGELKNTESTKYIITD